MNTFFGPFSVCSEFDYTFRHDRVYVIKYTMYLPHCTLLTGSDNLSSAA